MYKEKTNNILMNIDKYDSIFNFDDKSIKIPVGYSLLEDKYLKNTPPTPSEIEYAINYTEDEIEKLVPLLPKDFEISCKNDFVVDIAVLSGKDKKSKIVLKTDELEYLFGQYAEVSQGRVPSLSQKDISAKFYSKLLILREFVHHLKVDNINIIHKNAI
ncbi:hypothetical protein [Halarcobacter sp.]|uniref:hypothetical protein n=1 Tax=Halarcobacter sp. TaxID=2321133 RepID=UPI0029F5A22D|nr:hypothetical protein [Halarcobacter sp.]